MRRVTSSFALSHGPQSQFPALTSHMRPFIIPPQLVKYIITAGLFLAKALIVAHKKESRRLRQEESNPTASYSAAGNSFVSMPSTEALQILGLDSNMAVPLTSEANRNMATLRFERLFAVAVNQRNMFLQGKLSGAYRICVDPEWDAKDDTAEEGSRHSAHDGTKR
uniref:Uncharacterized protein n=1 Tax=Trypanosoma congolense (strain IL3000) TaxID=1068625 RepID=G0UUV5_TRYCI|nr:conserved hypothetical protein [Trypanosoma congolense IL3000]